MITLLLAALAVGATFLSDASALTPWARALVRVGGLALAFAAGGYFILGGAAVPLD